MMLKGRHDHVAVVGARDLAIGATLFASLFAAQASVLALSLILPDIAGTFGVTTATAGQLRTLSGLAAGVAALGAPRLADRVGVPALVNAGLVVLSAGALMSGAAASFAWLASAQVALGIGVTAVLTGGIAAAAAWPSRDGRARALSWALNGQPVAWVVGMPLIGAVAGIDWRLAWLTVPLGSALVALLALRGLRVDRSGATTGQGGLLATLRYPAIRRWAVGELLAYAAWTGTLVYVGALLMESYAVSTAFVGLALGVGAVGYVPGNLVARRRVDGASPAPLAGLAVAIGCGIAVLGVVRPSPWFSAMLFALLACLAGARGYAGSIRGLAIAPESRVAIGGVRAAATQFGYLIGSAVGGAALTLGGYVAMGIALAGLALLAALPSTEPARSHRASGAWVPRPWRSRAPAARMHHGR